MKHILLVLVFSITTWQLHAADSLFFENQGAVRYDFELVGGNNRIEVVKKQVKYLPHRGDNYSQHLQMPDYGSCRYRIFDAESDTLVFRKGFSPLFKEWQITDKANNDEVRSYYQALFFPKPKSDVVLKIDERTFEESWQTIWIDTIRIDDPYIISEKYPVASVDTILFHGEPDKHVDLVILAEGYTENELVKFSRDARRLSDSLFAAEPFKTYKTCFNVLAMQVPSVESGTDIPDEHIYRNTAFNSHFYTFGSARYLTTSDMRSVYDAIDGVAWDHIYILVNEKRYGGGGFYNYLSICTSDNAQSPFVFCHEFGHAFAGLADEYYTSSTTYESFYNLDVEPWEPNITTMMEFDKKWFSRIKEGTPVPTPRNDEYAGKVGVFEGGGYEAKGIYSPVMSCWMKERKAGAFCPVCSDAIEKTILLYCQ